MRQFSVIDHLPGPVLHTSILLFLTILTAVLAAAPSWGDEISDLKKRAERNDPEAQYRLAVIYANGKGVPKDFDKASQYLIRAAEHGHQEAKKALNDPQLLLETRDIACGATALQGYSFLFSEATPLALCGFGPQNSNTERIVCAFERRSLAGEKRNIRKAWLHLPYPKKGEHMLEVLVPHI